MENTQKQIKRVCYYHDKDLDGFFSGAVVKYKYPDIELRGWDYRDPVPQWSDTYGYDEIILIDITFPLVNLIQLGNETKVTVIDHHISFKRQVDEYLTPKIDLTGRKGVEAWVENILPFEYIFDQNLSACELGFQHYFGYIPPIVELVGKYDTWRANGTPEWEETVLPVKYYLYGIVNKPEEVLFHGFLEMPTEFISKIVNIGKAIMNYENKMNESKTNNYAFEREAYGLRALCMNTNFFSSETMKTMFDPEKHDIMIGFAYTGDKWSISLRSIEGGADASIIARERGGGGHKGAAGFEVKTFEEIWQ